MAAGPCGDYGPLPYLHLSAEKRNARLPPDRAFRLFDPGKAEAGSGLLGCIPTT